MSATVTWPVKSAEMHNQHIDSTIWNDFKFRDDDIIISTYAKSGTTWMQQIIAQMLFDGDTEIDTQAMSPWMDFRLPPKEVKLPQVEAQTHRRFIKTHLPVDALRKNLATIIERAQGKKIRVVLAGMEAPPNFGQSYTDAFHRVYTELAAQYKVPLIPFLLQGVAGIERLNQRDGIHPTPEGARIVADNVWTVLRLMLKAT